MITHDRLPNRNSWVHLQLVHILSLLGDNLLVGTRQGHLLLYGVKDGTGNLIVMHAAKEHTS